MHEYKCPPMDHQVNALRRAWKLGYFALFHEMGTGKTFTAINLAAARYNKNQIEGLVVICPTAIKLVWESELEKFCPVDYECVVLTADKKSKEEAIYLTTKKTEKLKVLVIGVEALSQGAAGSIGENFAKLNRVMTVCDESSRLKNANAGRTKRAITIASESLYRMLMTGTPITQGIEDLYGQFQFLNPKIIGCKSFFQFRNRYCVLGGFENKKIIGYQNTNELMERIAPYIDIVKKEEVLDLPPKVYERRIVDPTPHQKKLIESLKDTFEAQQGDEYLVTETILERLTRFQQIIGGNFPFNTEDGGYDVKPIEGKNPKLEALMDVLDEVSNDVKVIIWARFRPEARLISTTLREKYGDDIVVTFTGSDDLDDRRAAVTSFQTGNARFMISNPQLGGMGQTWTAATLVIYYSNSFSYEDRTQSEDRAHRKGQENKVTYIDIEANHRYDKMILAAIGVKGGVARYVEEQISHNQGVG
jgi:SNF2 family DNA or RNA helicase